MRLPGWIVAFTSFAAAQTVEFNRDIRPILSDRCYTCHGPDQANRKTKLRFDVEGSAKGDLGKGRFAIVPGSPAKSELYQRVTSKDPVRRMPPAYLGHAALSDREIGLLRRWIEQGAQWQKHWSFLPPKRPVLPKVSNPAWVRNGIDYFVLERLDREGLKPSPEADRATLIRRVTLDLTGLPPTIAEVDAFLADTSPDAYHRLVDRLLASPRYGERMAARWLDAARYADTNGYQTDAERFMWRWRDWVIGAFRRNLSFDRFIVEQIAGDMLPNPTLEQRIATGFNRNHRGNGEGGIIPEEYAVEYVVDRVETTSTVFLGLTMGCARCHDHKYDPIAQKEFYRVFAYFNNIGDRGRYNKYGNTPPMVKAPTPDQEARLRELDARQADAETAWKALEAERTAAQRAWEQNPGGVPADWSVAASLLLHKPLDHDGPGRVGQAAAFDGLRYVDAGNVAAFGFYDKFTLAAWIYPTAPTGAVITRAQDVLEGDGYGLYLKDGKLQLNLVQRWLDDALRVETAEPLALNQWHHVAASYDGTREASGVRFYVNGRPAKLKINLDELNQNFTTREPLRIGGGGGPENRFRGAIDEARVYERALTPQEVAILAEATPVTDIARLAPAQRSSAQSDKVTLYFLEQAAPENIRRAWQELLAARASRDAYYESIPTVMVMEELTKPKDTFFLIRGAYDRPGEKVTPGVPASLHPLPKDAPNNRFGFARWLVDPANPLTARVAVNRFWQMYFGTGIVKTVEDFGSQGEWPSHPELLDWLATEFVRSGWNVKDLQKLIVTSATYRQASRVTPELHQRDPDNRLLARGPRVRLAAEMVRDQALAISGLLVERIGGPSVKPYQPAGLWRELAGGQDYPQDHGEKLYRRSLYTYWKRAAPPPSMMNFDAAGREACVVRETRTNTPLQALNLMNDVTFLEASRILAERVMREGGSGPAERLGHAFRLATARQPRPEESEVLLAAFRRSLDRFQTDREAAIRFLTVGEYPRDKALDPSELAAYATVASLILNLDEVVTKQ
jgi:hypothetical protein